MLKRFYKSKLLVIVLAVAILGTVTLLLSHAQGTSTISGTIWQETDRNGVFNPGETPLAGVEVDLLNADQSLLVANTVTDANGNYSFGNLSDGNYVVKMGFSDWINIRYNWVPDTTGSIYPQISVSLSGTATANMGWRPIVRSTNLSAPINTYTGPNGLKVNSYDDVVLAKTIYDHLMQGSLIGKEAQYVTVDFDYSQTSDYCAISIGGGGNGSWSLPYAAAPAMAYLAWLDTGDNLLFHEYGHAWSYYYSYLVQQDDTLSAYLKVRGIYGDPRLGSSHAWDPHEMIAEDYRQLFGSADAQQYPQENRDIPAAAQVPGLKEYLMGAFMTGNVDTTPPSVPTGLNGKAVSQSEINLSWSASTDNVGVAKYNIYRNGILVGFTNSPTTTYADSSLSAGTSYQYYVKALDAAGNVSPASSTITVTTLSPDTTAPTAPSNLHATSTTSTSISLAWNASTDNVGVAGYRIYRSGGSRSNSYTTVVGTTSSTSFTVTGLSKNTSYSFYIVAYDAAGNNSPSSNTLSVKTAAH